MACGLLTVSGLCALRNRFLRHVPRAVGLAVLAVGLLAGSGALAAPYTFDAAATGTAAFQDGSGTWDTVTPTWWTGSAPDVPWINGNDAVFGGGVSGTAGSVTVSGAISANSLTFNTPFAGSYNLNGTGGSLAIAANGFIADNSSGSSTVAVPINFGSGAALTAAAPVW